MKPKLILFNESSTHFTSAIKLLIFDLFGTLVFISQKSIQQFIKLSQKFGYSFDFKDFKKKTEGSFFDSVGWTKNWKSLTKIILQKFNPKPEKKAIEEISTFLKRNLIFKFYPDVKIIKKLPFRKVILTTAPRFLFSNLKLRGFEKIFTPTNLRAMKPDPKAFLSALKILKVLPKEALMISNDLERDLIPAKNLGMKTILIDRENKIKKAPVRKISSLTELKKILSDLVIHK